MLCCHPEGGLSNQTNSGKTEIYQIVILRGRSYMGNLPFLSSTVVSKFLVVTKLAS